MEPNLVSMLAELQRSHNDLREDIRSSREALSEEMTAMRQDMTALRRDFEEALGGDFRTSKDGLVAKVERSQKATDSVLARLTAIEVELTTNREVRGAMKEQIAQVALRLSDREKATQSLMRKAGEAAISTIVPALLLSLLAGGFMLLRSRFM
jgi:DNA repair exonuclease SbcCD ATPase subunit